VARRDIVERLEGLPTERVRFFDMPRLDVSSSAVRRRVAAGRTIRYLVPDGVAERIAERGLYRAVRGSVTR
jgi:nicotinate-nucleotide adenylyltransferase